MVWIIFTNKLHDVAKDRKAQMLVSSESVPLKTVIHFCSNFCKTCPKKLHHPPILPTSSIREEDFLSVTSKVQADERLYNGFSYLPGNRKDLSHSNILVRNHVFNFSGN